MAATIFDEPKATVTMNEVSILNTFIVVRIYKSVIIGVNLMIFACITVVLIGKSLI
jgi:hypothetical protein